ncbi:MAG TPA: hypothetical protein VF132_10805, partial [Rudaea sp.]
LIGGGSGLVAVRVRARRAGETVHLRIDADELDAPGVVDGVLAQNGVEYQLAPRLQWNPARFSERARATTLHVRLQRDGGAEQTFEQPVSLRPVSEALYFVRDGRDSVDLSWIFAAYVNENDPVAARIADDALRSGIVDRFEGYGDEDAVYRQVWAVWQALAAHGIRYSDADPGIARGPNEFSQRVRLLEQTWDDRSANCIDGSVLIASVLQRIGLRSFLVLVPGHAFVGFYLDTAAKHAAYLETTLLGAAPPPLRTWPRFAADFDNDAAHHAGIDGFAAALASGNARHARIAGKLDGRHAPDYAVIDIGVARAFGIVPIAFSAVEAGGRAR